MDVDPRAPGAAPARGLGRRPRLAAGAVALLAALHAASFLALGPVDDDFIDYRYARHLVEGAGLVFNPGERVEGITAPLHVLLCALGIALRLDPAAFTQGVGIAASALAAYALARAEQREDRPRFPLAALLVAASPAVAYHAVAGLGTPLLALFLALFALGHLRDVREGRTRGSTVLVLGLAVFARPEAVLFALPWWFAERRRGGALRASLALAPLVAWSAFRLAYYGKLVPTTYLVKKLPFLVDLGYGARYLALGTAETAVGICVVIAIAAVARGAFARGSAERTLACGLALHAAYVVYVGGDYLALARFFVPVLPVAYLLAVAALASAPLAPRLRLALGAAAVLILQWPQARRPELARAYEQLERRWIAVGRTLAAIADPGQAVAAEAVGALGWHSRLRIVDMLGLTNDHLWRVEPDLSVADKGHHRYDHAWMLDQRPEIVLLSGGLLDESGALPAFARTRGLLEDARFAAEYRAWAANVGGSYPLVFFLRRDARAPRGAQPIDLRLGPRDEGGSAR